MSEMLYVSCPVKLISNKQEVIRLQKEANLPDIDYDTFKDLRGFVNGLHNQNIVSLNYVILGQRKIVRVHIEAVENFLISTLPADQIKQENKLNAAQTDIKKDKKSTTSKHQLIDSNVNILKECLDKGDMKLFREKCRNNVYINKCEQNQRRTLIFFATAKGNLEALKILEEEGGDPNAVDIDGDTILHNAIYSQQFNVVKYICINYPHLLEKKNDSMEVPFLTACRKKNSNEISLYLLEKNATIVNEKNNMGYGAIHYISDMGNTELMEALLKYKNLDLGLINNDGNSAFHIACIKGRDGIVIKLMDFCNEKDCCQFITHRTNSHECGAQLALRRGYIPLAKSIITNNPMEWSKLKVNIKYGSILHTAVLKLVLVLVELIIKYDGKLVYVKNSEGYTPLDLAVELSKSKNYDIRLDANNIVKCLQQHIDGNSKKRFRLFSKNV